MPDAARRSATKLEVSHQIEIITSEKPEHEIQCFGQLEALCALIRDGVDSESERRHG